MILRTPEVMIEGNINGSEMLKSIERFGRTCYKSEDQITDISAEKFIKMIIQRGHESVLEHEKITVRVVCDRGVSHEIVRHRIASYSQESTRYCNYSGDKFSKQISVIKPSFWPDDSEKWVVWNRAMIECEKAYLDLINLGATPQEARSVLPNSLKTEIVITMNLREWRHFFRLRTSTSAHPQMKEIADKILTEFQQVIRVVFDDLGE
jgi:thymidylate synthase (FAD)